MFSPNSPQAQTLINFFYWTTGIGAVILLIVSVGVFYSAFRYRSARRPGEPPQISGNRNLELIWTGAPVILLIVLFGFAVNIMLKIDPDPLPPAQQQPDVVVTGYQWWWHVAYPQTGVVTANEIHIPVGKQVLFQLQGGDVIHSFWVPQLGPKRDMIPGNTNHLWLRADTPGVYLGACSEYCGTQHAWMRIRVIAQPQAEFDQWLQINSGWLLRQLAAISCVARNCSSKTPVSIAMPFNRVEPIGLVLVWRIWVVGKQSAQVCWKTHPIIWRPGSQIHSSSSLA